jgi:hypothetical protein
MVGRDALQVVDRRTGGSAWGPADLCDAQRELVDVTTEEAAT